MLTGGLIGSAAGAILATYVIGTLVAGSGLIEGQMQVDASTLAGAVAVLAIAAAVASIIPARHAKKVDPSVAIRSL